MNFPLMCRLCLIPSQMNQTFEIFDDSNEIPEKILELTNIQVVSEDGLPQEVCITCREMLYRSVTFKRQIQKADNMLRQYLTQQDSFSFCPSPAPVITGDPLSEEEEMNGTLDAEGEGKSEEEPDIKSELETITHNWDGVTIKEEDNFVIAEPWPEELSNTDSLTAEDSTHLGLDLKADTVHITGEVNSDKATSNGDNVNQIKQESWKKDSSVEETYKETMDEQINNGSHEDEVNIKCFGTIKCYCDICREIKQKKKTSEHSSENKITCELCGRKFEAAIFKKHQAEHIETVPGDWFRCPHCPMSFPTEKSLLAHQPGHAAEQDNTISVRRSSRPSKAPERHVVPHYSCSKCERMYSDQAALENHQKSHLGLSFKCNHCGKKFYSKELLEKHIQNVHLPKANLRPKRKGPQCNICGSYFENRSSLFSHMKSHKSTVQLCEVCGKTVSINAYPAHKRSHLSTSPEQVFHCDLCDKKFNNKVSLRSHKNTYHGIPKFTCEVCGKQFTTMALMKHHQHIHSGKRDYACQVCGRAFTLKITLKSHMRIHTGEMPYGCDNCGKRFTWKTTYRNHTQSCKKGLVNSDTKQTGSTPDLNTQHTPQNLSQELPIDYSDDTKYNVPIDYSEETKYPHPSVLGETKLLPTTLNLSEEIKYTYQQPISYN